MSAFKDMQRVSFEEVDYKSTYGKVDDVRSIKRYVGYIIHSTDVYAIIRCDSDGYERAVLLKHLRRLVKKKRQEFDVHGFDTKEDGTWILVTPEPKIYKGMRLREVKAKK